MFSAAVSELRTEIQVMRQKDTQSLKAETLMVTREVEALAQHIREDVDRIKNEIALDMDNRKNETRSEQKEIDMTIQELNNKFTVKLGEVRTGLETTRWETIWKGLGKFFPLLEISSDWFQYLSFFFNFSGSGGLKYYHCNHCLLFNKFCRKESRGSKIGKAEKEETIARRCP